MVSRADIIEVANWGDYNMEVTACDKPSDAVRGELFWFF
jgi:hypothetical protein